MNNIFKGVLLTIAFTTVLGQEPPIVGGFSEAEISDEVSGVAEEVLDQLASHFGAEDGCSLKLENITDVKTQVVAGTNYLFSLEISSDGESCENEVKICSDVKVYKPLPFACSSRIDTCLSLVESEKILCIPSTNEDPPLVIGEYSSIENVTENEEIQKVAQKAVKFLYHLFNTSSACPIHLREVVQASEQIVDGTNYKLEIQVETDGANFECEYVQKQCSNIIVHEPLAHCPHDEEDCILPVDLQEVECVEINQIFDETTST
ncbi:uncharacterized protein [Lepeophtheirus salmonis]|nr:uncharacterized protein LOC121117632 [Lepeophtheirus salmonis]